MLALSSVLGVLGVLGMSSLAAAAPENVSAPPAAKSRPLPVSFVVSGGATLGAYQAGFLQALVTTLKRTPTVFDFKLATGASAGSVNALLALFASCDEAPKDPTDSLLFRSWSELGFPALEESKFKSPVALFSRKLMGHVWEGIEQRYNAGFEASCDVVLGVSTTRLEAKKQALDTGSPLELPRTEEKFVLRMRGQGKGKPPTLENYVDSAYGFPQVLLPLSDSGSSFEVLRDLLYASGAYPFAFEPVALAHCMSKPDHPEADCTKGRASKALFIDGGVFDNQPLGLAARVAGDGFSSTGDRVSFVSPLRRKNAHAPDDALFVYVDPDTAAYPDRPETDGTPKTYSARRLAFHYLDAFISSAQSKELVDVIENAPELREKLLLPSADLPPISQTLASFFGFFDKTFRAFDFFLGMRAARRFSEGPLRQAAEKRGVTLPPLEAEDTSGSHLEAYRCIRAVLDRKGSSVDACKDASPQMRAILQTSMSMLYDRCARVGSRSPMLLSKYPACQASMISGDPPRVPFVPSRPFGFHRQRASEVELSYVVRLLSGYGFVFRDLGLEKASASEAEDAIHTQLRRVFDAFGAAQPESRALVDALSRTMLGQMTYVPPSLILHAGIGSVLEGGASLRLGAGPTRFLRATAAIDAGGLTSFTGGGGAYFTLAPMAGLEAELLPISSANFQTRLGIRAGYLFSTADAFLIDPCTTPDKRVCSRATAQVYGAVSIFERLRLQIAFAMLPAIRPGEDFSWSILPTGGVQFLWP